MNDLMMAASIALDHAERNAETNPDLLTAVMEMIVCLIDELGDVSGQPLGNDWPFLAEQMRILEDSYFASCERERIIEGLRITTSYAMPIGTICLGGRCLCCETGFDLEQITLCSQLFVGEVRVCSQCLRFVPHEQLLGILNHETMISDRRFVKWARHRMKLANFWTEVADGLAENSHGDGD